MTDFQEISLFPLPVVLFPGGKTNLQIFERRYIDLIKHCMKSNTGFGVCLLKSGAESQVEGNSQTVHRTGTYAHIADWDQLENGLLGITVEGSAKFRVEKCWQDDSGVLKALVKFSSTDSVGRQVMPIDDQFSGLAELLLSLEDHPAVEQKNLSINYHNLWDLGWRLSDLIPLELEKKQDLLELDDPIARIEAIETLVAEMAEDG